MLGAVRNFIRKCALGACIGADCRKPALSPASARTPEQFKRSMEEAAKKANKENNSAVAATALAAP